MIVWRVLCAAQFGMHYPQLRFHKSNAYANFLDGRVLATGQPVFADARQKQLSVELTLVPL